MDRYSILHGTTQSGPYDRLGISANLATFLSRIGATSLTATTAKTESLLCGFAKLDGYDNQPADEYPLAVRYAPMHLYRLPDFPNNMEPFCAMAICGAENRTGGRDSVYSHTIYMSRTALQKQVGQYSYLDQIFGTPLTTAALVDGHRSGKRPIDLDALPGKFTPEMDIRDAGVVLRVVDAIYREKTVIIRLKKNAAFNRAAFRLLGQIYSMLQPRLATEIGFATYHSPRDIGELANLTSTRIFVLPGECPLEGLALSDREIIDLQDPNAAAMPAEDPFIKCLKWWYKLPWQDRLDAYTVLFDSDTLDYLNKEKFIEITTAFRNDPFFQWAKAANLPDAGTLRSPSEVLKKKRSFPVCAISWVGKIFDQRIPELLKPNTLKELVAEAAVEAVMGPDKERGKAEFLAGRELGCEDVTGLACKKTRDRVRELAAKSMAELKEAHEGEKTALRAVHDRKVAEITGQYEEKLGALMAQLAAKQDELRQREDHWKRRLETEREDSAAKLKAERENFTAKLEEARQAADAVRAEMTEALRRQEEEAQASLRQQQTQAEARLTEAVRLQREEGQAALGQQKAEFDAVMDDLKTKAAEAIRAERSKTQTAEEQAEKAGAALRQCRQELETARAALEKERAALDEASDALEDERAAHGKTQEKLRRVQSSGTNAAMKKNLMISMVMGFVAGLLVLGIIWGSVALFGGKDVPDSTNPPITNQEPADTTGSTESTGSTNSTDSTDNTDNTETNG